MCFDKNDRSRYFIYILRDIKMQYYLCFHVFLLKSSVLFFATAAVRKRFDYLDFICIYI